MQYIVGEEMKLPSVLLLGCLLLAISSAFAAKYLNMTGPSASCPNYPNYTFHSANCVVQVVAMYNNTLQCTTVL